MNILSRSFVVALLAGAMPAATAGVQQLGAQPPGGGRPGGPGGPVEATGRREATVDEFVARLLSLDTDKDGKLQKSEVGDARLHGCSRASTPIATAWSRKTKCGRYSPRNRPSLPRAAACADRVAVRAVSRAADRVARADGADHLAVPSNRRHRRHRVGVRRRAEFKAGRLPASRNRLVEFRPSPRERSESLAALSDLRTVRYARILSA